VSPCQAGDRQRPRTSAAGKVEGVDRTRTIAITAFALWAVTWLFIGLRVANEVKGLRELSDTVVEVGAAVRSSGETLGRLSAVPIVGQELEEPSERIVRAGESAIESGRASRDSVRDLSLLLGISIAVIPSVPLAVLLVLRVGAAGARRRTGRPAARWETVVTERPRAGGADSGGRPRPGRRGR
jgi:hypothetical protein